MTRRRAGWMWQIDDRILEFLRREGPVLLSELQSAVSKRACDVWLARADIAGRIERLLQYNLVSRTRTNLVFLSDLGEAYLEGDLDAETLQPTQVPSYDSQRPSLVE